MSADRNVRVVIGTGGVGAAIARRLAAVAPDTDVLVVVADVLESRAESVAAKLTTLGHAALARVVDVGDRTSVRTLAIECATLGRVTSVAHTAGVSPMQADIATIVRVDLVGTALVLEEFGAVVAAGGAGVVVASMAGQIFGPHLSEEELVTLAHAPAESLMGLSWLNRVQDPQTAYGYAKRGNQARVVAAAASWAARGARVNAISPGVIDTEMGNAELTGDTGDLVRAQIEASAIGRAADPDEIAAAMEFLLSRAASFITGTDLLVDGGTMPVYLLPARGEL